MYKVAGLDVHKDSTFCCVKRERYQSGVKVFSTTTEGLRELCHFLHGEAPKIFLKYDPQKTKST